MPHFTPISFVPLPTWILLPSKSPFPLQTQLNSQHSPKQFNKRTLQLKPSYLYIGGGGANPSTFSTMARQANTRKSFIDSSIKLARSNNFHGLDLDWEYPSTSADMANFGSLLTEWKTAVANESSTSGKTALLLSAAVF
ncbi:Glycoside hydrolase family 18, catalytic domain [Sesbania bispinosa]|nr:Glycoside hydrolase family 18, catalytic domain [Sesbania bispinosa]